ncbi:hypothetical protein P8C59_001287 [Phyllachora maydis]|uniref:Uncharacterized protein n=1 Tax=Phyllachora maydis TaxID=1825666 RepID=A0AAD9HXX2_9PEZI|nr:hypothetical protein P8C59_001287 [Phyllachora maydis]
MSGGPSNSNYDGSVNVMGRGNSKKSNLPLGLPWQWPAAPSQQEPEEPKLPPLEAFSFKSIMADLDVQGGASSINADLDRIAEICARSRYSLSNQYEVHVAPHGSSASFASSATGNRKKSHRRGHSLGGPTLQAISDDDETSAKPLRKRRGGARRPSVAMGTLETIMSSSRSSEEEKSQKKSAAEIGEDIRGRSSKNSGIPAASGSGSTENGASGSQETTTQASTEVHSGWNPTPARKKSTVFSAAFMDAGGRAGVGSKTPRVSASLLVGEPAVPQTSLDVLEIRTLPDGSLTDGLRDSSSCSRGDSQPLPFRSPQTLEAHSAEEVPHAPDGAPEHEIVGSSGLFISAFSSWVPSWGGGSTGAEHDNRLSSPSTGKSRRGHAAGSLRELLKATDMPRDKALEHNS